HHGLLRICSHAGGPQLMDRPALGTQALPQFEDLEACRLEHLARGLRHVSRHFSLVVAELIVEAKDWDSPAILHGWVQVDVILVASEHFAKAAHADEGAGLIANRLLELRPKSQSRHGMPRKDFGSALTFETVAANEIRALFRKVAETGEIEATWTAVVQGAPLADEILDQRGDARPHQMLAEVVSHMIAGVADSVGVLARLRKQHQARRFQRGCAEHDHT